MCRTLAQRNIIFNLQTEYNTGVCTAEQLKQQNSGATATVRSVSQMRTEMLQQENDLCNGVEDVH